ncbi:MAG TPA: DUF3140 domain-containing protein [Marmoricola sp.]
MAHADVSDGLWTNFHLAVNMTSRELEDWLRVDSAGEDTEALPDQAGSHLGRRVLEILGKRRGDLTPADVSVMTEVVVRVASQRGDAPETMAGDASWRHGLMRIGHDPLRPAGERARS